MAATLRSWRARRPAFAPVAGEWTEAVRAAVVDSRTYAFRCNREVIDVFGRFRGFQWRGVRYVAKRAESKRAAERERDLAAAADRRLSAVSAWVKAIVPTLVDLEEGGAWLASPYLGASVQECLAELRLHWEGPDVLRLLDALRRAGLEWAGCAPRNLIACGERLFAIDWEDLAVDDSPDGRWSKLTLFKLALNWSLVFGTAERAHAKLAALQPNWRSVPLDGFERSWRGLCGAGTDENTVRDACNALCFESEQAVPGQESEHFSAQEMGHLASDLLGSPADVFYAAATARLRHSDRDNARFRAFLRDSTRRVDLALQLADRGPDDRDGSLIRKVMAQMTGRLAAAWPGRANADLLDASRGLRRLRGRRGLAAAALRAKLMEDVTIIVWRAARDLFSWEPGLQLLFRGSIANGVCSIHSDLDFEISSPARPEGFVEAEALLQVLLKGLGVESEGSLGRPTEQDVLYADGSRDVLEWLELRNPDGAPWPHGSSGRARLETLCLGEYERSSRCMDGKGLWIAVRGVIARASAMRGCQHAKTLAQLAWLGRIARIDVAPLRALLRQALAARELGLERPAVEPLARVAASLGVPTPLWRAAD